MKRSNISPIARFIALGVCLVSAVKASPLQAASYNLHKVLRTQDGSVVHAQLNGSCVRTTWQAGDDVCAPKPQPKIVAYVEPSPPPPPPLVQQKIVQEVLSADERVVYFPFDSATLTPEAKAKLDGVASKLSAASSVKGADIVGYADRLGSSSYNLSLSQKRAHAVQDYLSHRGYLSTRLAQTRGLGENGPITDCPPQGSRESQIACLSPDRRVELEIRYGTTVEKTVTVPQQRVDMTAPMPGGELIYSQSANAQP